MGFFQRGLLIYLCLAIAICFAAPSVVFNSGSAADNTVLSWFNLAYNPANCVGQVDQSNCITMTSSVVSDNVGNTTGSFTTITSPSSSGSLIGFIDPVFQVFSWIPLVFKVLFSPIILLSSSAMAGAPPQIMLMFGIPLVFMTIIGLIIWIRSGFA